MRRIGCAAGRRLADQTASKSNIPRPRRAVSSGVAVAFEVERGRDECPGARVTPDVLETEAAEEFLIQVLRCAHPNRCGQLQARCRLTSIGQTVGVERYQSTKRMASSRLAVCTSDSSLGSGMP